MSDCSLNCTMARRFQNKPFAPMTDSPTKPHCRLLRFSLRAMLLLVVVIALPLGWKTNRVRNQQAAIAEIEQLGGQFEYDYQRDWSTLRETGSDPPAPQWLRRLLSDDFFANVTAVHFQESEVTVRALHYAESLPEMKMLLLGWTTTTDDGLANLDKARSVRILDLDQTPITDVGMVHLACLDRLEDLRLWKVKITDKSLSHLSGCRNLKYLDLRATGVTDEGLCHLYGLSKLGAVELNDTAVTDAGADQLRKALPSCRVKFHPDD
jgi:hypothetical protein